MRSVITWLSLLLTACQSANPYRAESLPIPTAPPGAASTFDRSAYPAPPRDYGHYRSWSWADGQPSSTSPAADAGQLAQSISATLDQYGLRPAISGSGELLVRAHVEQQTRLYHYQDNWGGYYGSHPHWNPHYAAWGTLPITRSVERKVTVARIDLVDAHDRQIVWSGQGEAFTGQDQAAQASSLRAALRAALNGYPPY
ncbi:DUF4136 domain-containing protein [Pseudomonas sp. NCCP-436]|uniref:DUF4136 domain-containing protein n=1 Tax=Pseudomonas sp. NCCP-436 TaxID=2842481 RepID=UPI001C7E4B6F|nr:DUF4136 domain-containing protein [Pseudomonas sp. NCCP-436]GIZ12956.1 lipoprotein [Pseudomonas sp. NCCP-436]